MVKLFFTLVYNNLMGSVRISPTSLHITITLPTELIKHHLISQKISNCNQMQYSNQLNYYPVFSMFYFDFEQVNRIELSSSAWKADALTVVLYLHNKIEIYILPFINVIKFPNKFSRVFEVRQ